MREKRIEEGSGSGSCSLLPLPAKGKVANWEGGGLGEIREKGWHTLKPMQGMMHTTMIIQTVFSLTIQLFTSCCIEKRLYWKPI